jgi:hypothetical protein
MAINTHPRRGYLLHANQGLAPAQPDLKASAGSTGGQLTIFHALAQRRHAKAHAHPRGREHLPVLRGGPARGRM